jgi:hypothetical protein
MRWGTVFLALLVVAVVSVAPFIGWGVFESLTLAAGERSREIASLYVLLLLPRVGAFSLGSVFVTEAIAPRLNPGRALWAGLWGVLGVIGAAAVFFWSQIIAPHTGPMIVPGAGEFVTWIVVGALSALALLGALRALGILRKAPV